MRSIHYLQCRGLDRRMFQEVRTDQVAVPRPLIFRVGGGVNTDEAAPMTDEALERRMLIGIEHRTSGVEEDDHSDISRDQRR
jgi:hypothetical protein